MQKPTPVPELGFYYHYKHDASGDVYNYAYEVVGVGAHTEEDDVFFVVYRPLYKTAMDEFQKMRQEKSCRI